MRFFGLGKKKTITIDKEVISEEKSEVGIEKQLIKQLNEAKGYLSLLSDRLSSSMRANHNGKDGILSSINPVEKHTIEALNYSRRLKILAEKLKSHLLLLRKLHQNNIEEDVLLTREESDLLEGATKMHASLMLFENDLKKFYEFINTFNSFDDMNEIHTRLRHLKIRLDPNIYVANNVFNLTRKTLSQSKSELKAELN